MRIVILGLSVTSSWQNEHAAVYRALMRGLHQRGHSLLFLERALPWYAANRDLQTPAPGHVTVYRDVPDLQNRFSAIVRAADLVIVGSGLPEGATVCDWVLERAHGITAFYDLDPHFTLVQLETDSAEYVHREAIPRFDLYLSSAGGEVLKRAEAELGAQRARPLYASVDTQHYFPEERKREWHLGYTGAFQEANQPVVEHFLIDVARIWPRGRFVVVGSQYPEDIVWPRNVGLFDHLSPTEQRGFYNAQAFTLSLTGPTSRTGSYSPRLQLLEAAACGTALITNLWEGLEHFFEPGKEVLVARDTVEVRDYLRRVTVRERSRLSAAARKRCLAEHTGEQRGDQLEAFAREVRPARPLVSMSR